MSGSRHRHADDIFRLLGGALFLARMDPGAMLTDIRHLEEILVDTRLTAGITEQRFMCPWGASCQNQSVEAFLRNRIGDLLCILSRTCKEVLAGPSHVRQG